SEVVEVGARQVGRIAPSMPPVREEVDAAVLASELVWLGDFLAFEGTPLGKAAEELSDHFDLPVEVLDSTLAAQTVRGVFFEESFEDVLRVICRAVAARCSILPPGAMIGP